MKERVEISVNTLQTKLHMDQAVAVSKVGVLPAVFIILKKDAAGRKAHQTQPDALTAMSAERAREVAIALCEAADSVDRLNAEKKEGV